MSTFRERFKWVADQRGWSLREFDRRAGRHEGHAQALVKGTIATPTMEVVSSYARAAVDGDENAVDQAAAWLAFGVGPTPELPTTANPQAA